WQDFFSGLVLQFPETYSPEQTRADAAFLVETLAPAPGARILDVPCGRGRIAFALAERGYHVSGVDLTPEFIDDARRSARERGLTVQFEQRNMLDLPADASFDHAYCFGNSFGYFLHEGNQAFLRAVHQTLKPGGS